MRGFISLHRKLMENPLWSDANYLKLWIYCLFKASHKEHEQLVGNQMVKLQIGQFVTGRNVLADDMNRGVKPKQQLDELTWWRYLKNLEKWKMLNIKPTNKFSVITIEKYEKYQDVFNKTEPQTEQQLNNNGTTNEQQLNTNNNGNNGNKEYIVGLYEHYLSKKIILHTKLTEPMKTQIRGRLKDYSFEQLKKAIDNYDFVLKSPNHYYSYKLPLADLMRDKDIRKFVDEADPLNNFLDKKKKPKQQIDWEDL